MYLIRTNFRGHLISRILNTNISRALIFAILQKMMNLEHLISRKLTKDRLRKPFFTETSILSAWYKTSLDCNHMFPVTITANNEIEATVTHSFLCAIRRFHVYKEVWKPIFRERLNLSHKRENMIAMLFKLLVSDFRDGLLTESLVTYPERSLALGLHAFFF